MACLLVGIALGYVVGHRGGTSADDLVAASQSSERSPWLGPALREPPVTAIEILRTDAAEPAPPDTFQQHVDAATASIRAVFNLDS